MYNDPYTLGAAYSLFVGGVGLVFGIITWILMGFVFYRLGVKAKVANPWLSFIPIANLWPYMAIIKKSAWNILWFIVPVANIVFSIIFSVRMFKAFNMSPWWVLLAIAGAIPFVGPLAGIALLVLYCYMGFSSRVQYNPHFDQPTNLPPNNF